jgi:LysM repeat protein
VRGSDWNDGELLRLHDEPRPKRRHGSRFSIWTLVAPVALLASVSVIVVIARGAGWVGPDVEATIFTAPTGTSPTAGTGTASAGTGTGTKPNQTKIFYTVRSGDTLEAIATRYGTTVAKLVALNPDVNPSTMRIGQRIRLR